jgi:cell wall-associated NlpC family hydrolase
MNKYDLQTGDILLFNNTESGGFINGLSKLIKWGTHSNYTHVAMVLKDPSFIHPSLKGLYVWESSYEGKPDPQDGKVKLGVQIAPLCELLEDYVNGDVILRKLEGRKEFTFSDKIMEEVHSVAYNKPYDIIPSDWISALFKKDAHPQKTDRFWCSALVGYIYTKLGILNHNTDWSILTPNDFSLSGQNLNFTGEYKLSNDAQKIN